MSEKNLLWNFSRCRNEIVIQKSAAVLIEIRVSWWVLRIFLYKLYHVVYFSAGVGSIQSARERQRKTHGNRDGASIVPNFCLHDGFKWKSFLRLHWFTKKKNKIFCVMDQASWMLQIWDCWNLVWDLKKQFCAEFFYW